MKKNKVLLLIFLLLISLLFNCDLVNEDEKSDDDDEEKSSYWKSSYGDGFEIKYSSPNKFYQYDDADKTISFAGNIVNNPNLSASSGYITVQITDSGSWGYTVGHYTVVSWKNFSGTGISESSAYKAGESSYLPTQSEAEAEFTIENGYFSFYGDYLKQ